MVHYDPPIHASPAPPPLCPKCGSHRTEVVGKSADGAVVIRCNACGERSQLEEKTSADADGVADAAAMSAMFPSRPTSADPNLVVDGIAELFDRGEDAAEPTGVIPVLRGFVVGGDLRRRFKYGWLRA
jgi:hypothetical protein